MPKISVGSAAAIALSAADESSTGSSPAGESDDDEARDDHVPVGSNLTDAVDDRAAEAGGGDDDEGKVQGFVGWRFEAGGVCDVRRHLGY